MISWLFEAHYYFVVSFCLFSFFLIVLFLFHNLNWGFGSRFLFRIRISLRVCFFKIVEEGKDG